MRTLIYGIGNPGRQDDALGVQLAEYIEKWAGEKKYSFIETDTNYQLNIEDAEKISRFELVLFCDASVLEINQVMLEEVKASLKTDFSMHSVTPSFVLALCQSIFNEHPLAYQLHIKGFSWDFMQPMTEEAGKNLDKAKEILSEFLEKKIRGAE
jgi:hydrogenase maturation protease